MYCSISSDESSLKVRLWTQHKLFTPVCPSIGWLVSRSVTLFSKKAEKLHNAHPSVLSEHLLVGKAKGQPIKLPLVSMKQVLLPVLYNNQDNEWPTHPSSSLTINITITAKLRLMREREKRESSSDHLESLQSILTESRDNDVIYLSI